METYGLGLSQVGQPCSHYQIIYSTSCKGHKSTAAESISHNMLGYLQSNPHIMINEDKWLQLWLRQLHFDRSLPTYTYIFIYAVCLLMQVATVGSLDQINWCIPQHVCFHLETAVFFSFTTSASYLWYANPGSVVAQAWENRLQQCVGLRTIPVFLEHHNSPP